MSDASRPVRTVGFIGLGRMGLPMCANLVRAGYRLTVHNRTPSKAAPLVDAGATYAATPAEVAERSEVILSCLDSVSASEQIFLGPDGVIARARPGAILVDHATIGPDTARTLARAAVGRGLEFLDAPVSGGPEGAERGTLTIMAGGPAQAFERVEPVFRAYGKTIVRMGEAGAGSLTKLVNQLLTFIHGMAAAEALAFAERVGLDLPSLGEVLRVSFGQSRMFERSLDRVLKGQFEAGAALRLYAKDLGLIERVEQEVELSLPLTRAADGLLAKALAQGLSDRDISALVLTYREPPHRGS
jgi:3-hydroxyisobutyrate dehydrogenase